MTTAARHSVYYEQRRSALLVANDRRARISALKRALRAMTPHDARQVVIAVLHDPEDWCLNLRVMDLFLAIPKVGRTRVARMLMMEPERVTEGKRIRDLSVRQRGILVERLAG